MNRSYIRSAIDSERGPELEIVRRYVLEQWLGYHDIKPSKVSGLVGRPRHVDGGRRSSLPALYLQSRYDIWELIDEVDKRPGAVEAFFWNALAEAFGFVGIEATNLSFIKQIRLWHVLDAAAWTCTAIERGELPAERYA